MFNDCKAGFILRGGWDSDRFLPIQIDKLAAGGFSHHEVRFVG